MACVSFNLVIEILQFLEKIMLNLSQLGHSSKIGLIVRRI
jgi:hypothetical protein